MSAQQLSLPTGGIGKVWIVQSWNGLRCIIGSDTSRNENSLTHSPHTTKIEDLRHRAPHERSAGDCAYLTPHTHDDILTECPVNLRSILSQASEVCDDVNFGEVSTVDALGSFEIARVTYGEPKAVQIALSSPFVRLELERRQRERTAQAMHSLLDKLNGEFGVRYLRSFVFNDFDPFTTFYIPIIPKLRVLGSITELRRIVVAAAPDATCEQVGEWIEINHRVVFSAWDLDLLFSVDWTDVNTTDNLATMTLRPGLEGWAVFRTDDPSLDYLYACPRIFNQSDLALRPTESCFLLDNGEAEGIDTRDVTSSICRPG